MTTKPPPNALCADCSDCVYRKREYAYMVLPTVWKAMLSRCRTKRGRGYVSTYDFLCITCLENRLRRKLNRMDFNWLIPLNSCTDFKRSAQLRLRMTAPAPEATR